MKSKFTFVEHSEGSYEGNDYNNVVLSDGLLGFKVRNVAKFDGIKEGDTVMVTFKIKGTKNGLPSILVTELVKA